MKILTPVNSLTDMKLLAEAGADEFYMGFYDEEWYGLFGRHSDLNRMSSYNKAANSQRIESVQPFAVLAHSLDASLYVTLNAASYSDAQLNKMRAYMERLYEYGADGVIISAPEQAEMAAQIGIPAVASTMCSVYNSDIARFYADMGVKRIILPRELSVEDISSIVNEVSGVEYEVFLMRNGCRYADSYCLGLHGGRFGGLCYDQSLYPPEIRILKDASWQEFAVLQDELYYNNRLYKDIFHRNACGQCAVWRFAGLGISALKIVGRADDPAGILQDVKLTRYNIETAKRSDSEAEYLNGMTAPEGGRRFCRNGLSCYYPEIRF